MVQRSNKSQRTAYEFAVVLELLLLNGRSVFLVVTVDLDGTFLVSLRNLSQAAE